MLKRCDIWSGQIGMSYEFLQHSSITWTEIEAAVQMQNLTWSLCSFKIEYYWSQRILFSWIKFLGQDFIYMYEYM